MGKRVKKLLLWLFIAAFLGGNVYFAPKLYTLWELHQRTNRQAEVAAKILYPTVEIDTTSMGERRKGTGVVIYSEPMGDRYDTYIITCAHNFGGGGPIVLEQIREIRINIYNKENKWETVNAAILAHDVTLDLALLKINSTKAFWSAQFTSAELFDTISVFEDVYQVGRIFGEIMAPVASKIMMVPLESQGRTQGPIFPGYSGGPCYLTRDLGLIGINQTIQNIEIGPGRTIPVPTCAGFISARVVLDWLRKTGYGFLYTKKLDDAAQDRINLNNKQVAMAPKIEEELEVEVIEIDEKDLPNLGEILKKAFEKQLEKK